MTETIHRDDQETISIPHILSLLEISFISKSQGYLILDPNFQLSVNNPSEAKQTLPGKVGLQYISLRFHFLYSKDNELHTLHMPTGTTGKHTLSSPNSS